MAKVVNRLTGKTASAKKPVPVRIVQDTPKAMPTSDYDKKWRAEEDLRSLQRAAEIKADRTRMNEAKKIATTQAKALANVIKGK